MILVYVGHMTSFREYLKQELERRVAVNPQYSLRSFARQVGVHHATLSGLLSGKRPITRKSVVKLSRPLALGPKQIDAFIQPELTADHADYVKIQEEQFLTMSEWYFDAILEYSLLRGARMNPDGIAAAFGLSKFKARAAIEILLRIGLLKKVGRRYQLVHRDTTNVLDPALSSAAQRKYQKQILEKSMEALELIERKKRDHTSMTMAVQKADVPKVKAMIQKFSFELNSYLQRKSSEPDSVYQLQISFFPLSREEK